MIEILRKAALLSFFVAFMACSSDDGQDVSGGNEEFVGDVSGVGTVSASKDFDTISGTKVSAAGTNIIVLQGTDNSGKGFLLRLSTYNGTGTYDLGFTNIANTATYIAGTAVGQQYSTAYQGTSGKITVTSDDGKRLEGTFEFVGKVNNTSTSVTVTNGKFKVNLQ
ncbi:hypothetical protein DFQ04_1891 [Algoriphagus boseongensis]|uniref:Lipoprotein n=2 Tax=Algoriphagus boseongensis TaxID=1442587 RepID=A0A4R6T5G6_9BACT|nr:hypothetical protein DFQ04_1891 [Algoriphagus boseongensis]